MKTDIDNELRIINYEILFRNKLLLFRILVYKITIIIVTDEFRIQFHKSFFAEE